MPGGAVLTTTSDVNRIEAPVTWKAYLICAFASFGGIFFGYDSGYNNRVTGSTVFIHTIEGANAKHLTGPHNSLIVSILSAGTFFGALIAGDCAEMIGRRTTIIIGWRICMVGGVLPSASHGLGLIVAGRLVAGIGVGFESAIVILYMSEIVSGGAFPKIFLQILEADVLNSRLQGKSAAPSLQAINSASPLAS